MGEDKRQNKANDIDPSHLALYQINMEVDSILYHDPEVKAVIQEMSFFERSGFEVSSLRGRFLADNQGMNLDDIHLLTPHSEASVNAVLPITVNGQQSMVNDLSARMNARLGREDIFMFMGKDSRNDAFRRHYPIHPLVLRTQIKLSLIHI